MIKMDCLSIFILEDTELFVEKQSFLTLVYSFFIICYAIEARVPPRPFLFQQLPAYCIAMEMVFQYNMKSRKEGVISG